MATRIHEPPSDQRSSVHKVPRTVESICSLDSEGTAARVRRTRYGQRSHARQALNAAAKPAPIRMLPRDISHARKSFDPRDRVRPHKKSSAAPSSSAKRLTLMRPANRQPRAGPMGQDESSRPPADPMPQILHTIASAARRCAFGQRRCARPMHSAHTGNHPTVPGRHPRQPSCRSSTNARAAKRVPGT